MLIAIEIGGTKLQLALGREDGTIVKTVRGRVTAEDGAQGILVWFDAQTSALLQEYGGGGNGQAEDPVRAIGVGFGGPLETATGTVLKSVQIKGWDNFSLKKWFEDRFGIPTFVFNDSSAAGYGEYRIGSGRGTNQFFYTNIGTGIGGSLIVASAEASSSTGASTTARASARRNWATHGSPTGPPATPARTRNWSSSAPANLWKNVSAPLITSLPTAS